MEALEQVNRDGRQRLYPSLSNPSWLVLRRRREIFKKWMERLDDRPLVVLDVGGRIQPYRELLGQRIGRYVGLDVRPTPLVDVVARAETLPFAGDEFDLVICTQVLQYLPYPGAVIAEIHRVLRPGGCLLMSAPSASPRDADHEAWRFLPTIVKQLLSPFAESEVVPEGGSIVGLFRTINACLNIFVRYAWLRSVFHWTLCPLVNLCGELFDKIAGSDNDQFAVNYSAWARK